MVSWRFKMVSSDPIEPQDQPQVQRRSESFDPSKLTIRQILESMTPGQIWKLAGTLFAAFAAVAVFSYNIGVDRFFERAEDRSTTLGPNVTDPSASSEDTVPIRPGTIIATHYPTGELFAVEPKYGTLRLLSARLGQPSGMVIRASGEIIVLDSDNRVLQLPQNRGDVYSTRIIGVNPENGYHRDVGAYLWPSSARAIALESESSALIALDGAIVRIDLESSQAETIASDNLLRSASGIIKTPSGEILVTAIPDRILRVNSKDGSTVLITQGDRLWYPRAPTVENSRNILVGTAGEKAGVIRVNLQTGIQELVATGPFTTIAGMALESNGSIIVADNGRGSSGDGFIARVDPATRRVSIIVSAQSSNWRFLNGRSVAVFPGGSSH